MSTTAGITLSGSLTTSSNAATGDITLTANDEIALQGNIDTSVTGAELVTMTAGGAILDDRNCPDYARLERLLWLREV